MKKDPPKAEKPKNAHNLKILREFLGLSQSEMAGGLGGVAQGSYKMWEFQTRSPTKIRELLFEAGVNLNWFDTGEGEMLRPGVTCIQVLIDGNSTKVVGLRPVMMAGNPQTDVSSQMAPGLSPDSVATAWRIIQSACAAAGARPDLMDSKGLGRLLAIVAEKVSRGDEAEVRSALLEEVKDLVGAMAGASKGRAT